MASRAQLWDTGRTRAGRFGKRAAERATTEAATAHLTAAQLVQDRWGNVPQTENGLVAWAQTVVNDMADGDARVIEAHQQAEQARQRLRDLDQEHLTDHADLSGLVLGNAQPRQVTARVARLQKQTTQARDLSWSR